MTIPTLPQSRSNAVSKFAAKNRDAVEADVMPEHHHECDQERHELDTKGLVRVQRSTRRLWILGDELEIAERGDGGDQKGDQERNPCCPTDFGGDVTSQGIHAGAEDVADDEQEQ